MLPLMRMEWKKVRVPVMAVTLLLTAAACVMTGTLYKNYVVWYDLDLWEIGTGLYSFLFPLFVVLPLCWNLYYERKDRFLPYVLPRVTLRKYLTAKWLVHALCAFFILFLPYLLSAVCALFVKAPAPSYEPAATDAMFDHVFLKLYAEAPLAYAFLLSLWRGLIGVLVMSFGYVLSLYGKNIFVILTGPFIYTDLENFILAVFRLEKYRLVVSFDPTTVSEVTAASFFTGPLLLAAVILFTAFFFTKVKKAAAVSL